MKNSKLLNCVLLTCIIGLCGCGGNAWEYKTVRAGSGLADSELDKLGASGWELEGYSRNSKPQQSDDVVYVFKRPKRNPDWWKVWK